ncbi:uncharacterized protein LOC144750757 [Ciona intestinalis]
MVQDTGKSARFGQFVEFVAKHAKVEASSYGRALGSTGFELPRKPMDRQRPRNVKAYNTEAKQQAPSQRDVYQRCIFCSQPHNLTDCHKYKTSTYVVKKSFARTKGICFKCLGRGHIVSNCPVRRSTCAVQGCSDIYHHTLLHPPTRSLMEVASTERQETQACSVAGGKAEKDKGPHSGQVCFQVVAVKVRYGSAVVSTYAFLDSGASTNFCKPNLIKALKAQGLPTELVLNTLSDNSKSCDSTCVSLSVMPLNGGQEIRLDEVFVVDNIPVHQNPIPNPDTLQKYTHLKGCDFPQINGGSVTLLIGAQVKQVHRHLQECHGKQGEPDAVKTILGWTLFGTSTNTRPAGSYKQACFAMKLPKVVQTEISCLWDTDFGDGTGIFDKPNSREDRVAYEMMRNSVKHENGKFVLPLPWRENAEDLPDNKSMAEKRLGYLKKRLLKDTEMKQRYTATVQSYIDNGYAEEIPEAEIVTDRTKWYLPHHPVINPKKPSKLRVVFDCAAKYRGSSLNDALMQGPDLVNGLVGVLTRFRKESVAVVADIEAMFHQIRVRPADCDALRFLWWPEGDLTVEAKPHRMLVHLFGATSSPSCAAFCLLNTAKKFGGSFSEETTKIIKDNFYVDDCLMSFARASEAMRSMDQLRTALKLGGFRLTKWLSNDDCVLQSVPKEERSSAVSARIDGCVTDRVLGVQWCVSTDEFGFNVEVPKKPPTRRGILSTISSIYDPLGFAAPTILPARRLLQRLCENKLEWDERVSREDELTWNKWLKGLDELDQIRIPRCFKPPAFGRIISVELHNFADASKSAYGAVSYLRLTNRDGVVNCSFLMGKSRLAPLKTKTIPRLELTAAVQKRFPVFVANRLAEIEKSSEPNDWRYVPTNENPADEATRGITPCDLNTRGRWLYGPEFLLQNSQRWPENIRNFSTPTTGDLAPLKSSVNVSTIVLSDGGSTDRLIRRYSTLSRLRKATAWLLRYKVFLWSKVRKSANELPLTNSLTVDEMKLAECELVKYTQRRYFPEVVRSLARKKIGTSSRVSLPKSMCKLNPILVEGVLRVGGRLNRAPVVYDLRHPAVIPQRSQFTELLIKDHHFKVGHSGMGHTWASLRQRYWIVKGGAAVRHVLGKCLPCRRRNSKPGEQMMAELPESRMQINEAAFSHVGIDYFGPLMVKQGRSQVKRYGCLFTCMTIRAVHLEVAHSLSTDSFIGALRRFIGRRGRPKCIYSDNGTNFVGAERTIRQSLQAWNQNQISEFLHQKEVKWKFNPPGASHMGGAWERMIRSVRRILSALSNEQVMNDEALSTLLTEAEAIVNSRPLTPITLDPSDDEPLTPNHILMSRASPNLPITITDPKDLYKSRWRQTQYLTDQFWKRWVKEYLPTIITRQRWQQPKRNLQKEDVVLIVDDTQPRSRWLVGRITETVAGKDGRVRAVAVRTRTGTLKRPITKLCPIVFADEGRSEIERSANEAENEIRRSDTELASTQT